MLMAPQGLDVLFSKDRLEIGRNFMNKLWNACRFIEMNTPGSWSDDFVVEQDDLELADKWILNQLFNSIEKTFIPKSNEAVKPIIECYSLMRIYNGATYLTN